MIKPGLILAAALVPSGVAAESLLEALDGRWALMQGSQAMTDAENIAAAQALCASGAEDPKLMTLSMADGGYGMGATRADGARVAWAFDQSVAGGKLPDGRFSLTFSVAGDATHEMIFWKMADEGTSYNLLEVTGPPNPPGLYLKCAQD